MLPKTILQVSKDPIQLTKVGEIVLKLILQHKSDK